MTTPGDETSQADFVAPAPEEIDALLADYEVAELIAQGGMGAVYRGMQVKLDRPVAIKVLPKQHGADLDFAARFEQEAKAMAKLSHNNIVGVYDYGETSDGALLYFIMEFVEGSDLFQALQNGPLPMASATPVLSQICSALAYAHENGIVHRDIKPANILMDREGNVRIADFGLAQMQAGGEEEEGTAFGTPDYVAPETLVEGLVVDHRADIYSLGVLTYEVLTGAVPKDGFVLPSEANPEIDRRFDDIILKTVTGDREERYANVGEIEHVLEGIAKTPRLMVASGAAAAPAVAVQSATASASPPLSATARVATVATGARKAAVATPPAKSGSDMGFIVGILLFAVLAGAGFVYWFVLRDPAAVTAGGEMPEPIESPEGKSGDSSKSDTDPEKDVASAASQLGPAPDLPPEGMRPPRSTTTIVTVPDGASDSVKFFGAGTGPSTDRGPSVETRVMDSSTQESVGSVPPGALRAYGNYQNGEPISLASADGMTGFVQLRARNRGWHALTESGEMVGMGGGEGDRNIKWIEGRTSFTTRVRNDGTAWQNQNQQYFPGELTNVVQVVRGQGHNTALLEDGTIKVWGERFEGPGKLVDPPVTIEKAIDVAASIWVLAIVEESGRVTCIGGPEGSVVREPENDGDRVVDVEAGTNSFVALLKSGKVITWERREANEAKPAPEELGPVALAVRASHGTFAALRPDQTWFAWGKNPNGIVDRINQLGPSPDIAFAGSVGEQAFGYVIWVEPDPSGSPVEIPEGPAAGRIAEVVEKSRNRYYAMADDPFRVDLGRLNDLYLTGLDRGAEGAEGAGDGGTAAAIREDAATARKLIADATDAGKPVPVIVVPAEQDPELISERLRGLRDTYRRELTKLEADRDLKSNAILNTCVSDLENLEAEVQAEFGSAEAEKVRQLLLKVQAGGMEALRE